MTDPAAGEEPDRSAFAPRSTYPWCLTTGVSTPSTISHEVEPSLKANSIGFTESLAIGLNATSPAYSLAAIIGPLVVIAGVAAPGVLVLQLRPDAASSHRRSTT